MAPLHLIACSSVKLAHAAPARDLYRGDLFRKSVDYCQIIGAPWRILSAKHGLVHPDIVLNPYDASLNTLTLVQQLDWANDVAGQLEAEGLIGEDQPHVVFLAGRMYRTFLADVIAGRACCDTPMAGLGIGEQKSWLLNQAVAYIRENPPEGTLAHSVKTLNDALKAAGKYITESPEFQAAARAIRRLNGED
jgi:hypothetical protein